MISQGVFTTGLPSGSIVDVVTGAQTLGDNLSIHALRTAQNISSGITMSGGTATINQATITGISSTLGLTAGMKVYGITGVTDGTVILTVDGANQITLANTAFASGSTVSFGAALNRTVTPTSAAETAS